MSFASAQDIGGSVVLEKLAEPVEGSLLFDVPNPESDIDPNKTIDDSRRLIKEAAQKRRDLFHMSTTCTE